MAAEIPGLDFRVWPNLGDEAEVRMAAFDYNVPPGMFAAMPNLGCIVFLGQGSTTSWKGTATSSMTPSPSTQRPFVSIPFMLGLSFNWRPRARMPVGIVRRSPGGVL